MDHHKILEKQIGKLLPERYLEDETILHFLSVISNSYYTFEKATKISEHAFTISEREYQEVTRHLQMQNEIKQRSILKLKKAISALDKSALKDLEDTNDDLINIIEFLQKQITKTKELESELIEAKEKAENATKAKSNFLSVMSHEIRTPLNAMTGCIHLLEQENPRPSQLDFLKILKISSDNLISLINDVLDFGKIEEGRIIFSEEDINIRKLVDNIRLASSLAAQENGNRLKIIFSKDIPVWVKGDDVRLTQILNNLITNAIKFTHKGNVTLKVDLKEKSSDKFILYFEVRDTGIGIPDEKQELMFERFTQENSDISRKYGGSGLGLAIVKKLLQLQNSDIYVKSIPGKGSTFYFSLTFGKSDAVSAEEKPFEKKETDLKDIRVLLVEDVEFNILMTKKMLSNWNARVDVAENGLIAIEKVKNSEFDIILMDLQMPVMDGLTSTLKIRKFNNHTPIIALTASSLIDIQNDLLNSGINDFISKPLNPGNLYSIIFKHCFGKEKRLR